MYCNVTLSEIRDKHPKYFHELATNSEIEHYLYCAYICIRTHILWTALAVTTLECLQTSIQKFV
jgi:hypothetical protein